MLLKISSFSAMTTSFFFCKTGTRTMIAGFGVAFSFIAVAAQAGRLTVGKPYRVLPTPRIW